MDRVGTSMKNLLTNATPWVCMFVSVYVCVCVCAFVCGPISNEWVNQVIVFGWILDCYSG